MARIWTNLTESAVSRKQVNINVAEMDDMSAQMAISEAMFEAGVAVHVAKDIRESILDFGVIADERDFTAEQYIAEAFSFGGFFGKIIDFLKKMWNTIVNYFKALIGNKFGASGNIMKLGKSIAEDLALLKAKKFDADAEVMVKKYDKLQAAAAFTGIATNVDLYLKSDLLDRVESKVWNQFYKQGNNNGSHVGGEAEAATGNRFNIVAITQTAAALADWVKTKQATRRAGTVKDEKGAEVGGGERTSTSAINDMQKDINGAVNDTKAFIDKISLGEKGAAETFVLILEAVDKRKGSALPGSIKTTIEKAKLKEAKSLSDLIKSLLNYFFPTDVKTEKVTNLEELVKSLEIAFHSVESKQEGAIGTAAGYGSGSFAIDMLTDPIKAALKTATQILEELNRAGETIKSFDKEDWVGTGDDGKANSSQSESNTLAGDMTKLGQNLTTISSNMQQVVTKGLDCGAVILETVLKEISAQCKLLLKADSGRYNKATVTKTGTKETVI